MVLPSPVGESVAANLISGSPLVAFTSDMGTFAFVAFVGLEVKLVSKFGVNIN